MKQRRRTIAGLLCLAAAMTTAAQGPNNTGTYYEKANGKSGAALKTALSECIYNRTERSYANLWEDFGATDVRPDGKIWDMYSGVTNYTWKTDQNRGTNGQEGLNYNREHSFPKSWFGGSIMPMYTDLNHMYPTDSWVNSLRSNFPFGEVSTATNQSQGGFSKLGPARSGLGYSGTVFEPNDEYKGDFARTYFYMVTCYDQKISGWSSQMLDGKAYPGLADWALSMLLRWAEQDPVSQKELERNEAVDSIQHNRNPFIDYPGLEQYIWGSKRTEAFNYATDASGISSTKADKRTDTKTLYNLNGQRMNPRQQPRRGIYVKGNKKQVVR